MADVRAKLEEDVKKIERVILIRLSKLGEECVAIARQLDTYKDQTGNLRNSVGYLTAKDGNIIKNNFKKTVFKSVKTTESKEGVKTGKELADSVLTENQKGFVLIVVAGMNYAEKVEQYGLDVLSSAEQYAKKELPRMKAKLKLDVSSMKWKQP